MLQKKISSVDQYSFLNAEFFYMDTDNINPGENFGETGPQRHAIPLGIWIACDNHKLELGFKNLVQLFN